MKSEEPSDGWMYSKGMALSYCALVMALIEKGSITSEEVVKALETFISVGTKIFREGTEKEIMIETMTMVRDAVLDIKPPDDSPEISANSWITRFMGNA